ncbi:hypothetical protein SMB59_004153 [Cronobacter muytjensii]|nr:hypothetical protein [Cronobacter muytjensii]
MDKFTGDIELSPNEKYPLSPVPAKANTSLLPLVPLAMSCLNLSYTDKTRFIDEAIAGATEEAFPPSGFLNP